MIKKGVIGVSLIASVLALAVIPAFARTSTSTSTSPTKRVEQKAVHERKAVQSGWTPAIGSCMANAVNARDSAISAAIGAYATKMQSAVQARQTALASAWQNSDATVRKAAIKTAWSEYRKAAKAAKTELRNSQRSAWKKFYGDRKACRPTGASEDQTTESVDIQ